MLGILKTGEWGWVRPEPGMPEILGLSPALWLILGGLLVLWLLPRYESRLEAAGREPLIRPTLFRSPYGAYNSTVQAIAAECGYAALVMWQGTTNDGRVELQEQVLKAGDVLLLHWREDLLMNLRNLKALADAQGLRVARLEDYLQPQP